MRLFIIIDIEGVEYNALRGAIEKRESPLYCNMYI